MDLTKTNYTIKGMKLVLNYVGILNSQYLKNLNLPKTFLMPVGFVVLLWEGG